MIFLISRTLTEVLKVLKAEFAVWIQCLLFQTQLFTGKCLQREQNAKELTLRSGLVGLPRTSFCFSVAAQNLNICQHWLFRLEASCPLDFPGGSDHTESDGNAGDPGSIPGHEDPLEKGMAIHSTIVAWITPCKEEPGGLLSMGLQRVGHDWATFTLGHDCGQPHFGLWPEMVNPKISLSHYSSGFS